jgi:hypothetical protein
VSFNEHSSNLIGTHAFLSPSSNSWLNYDEDKLTRVYYAAQQARRGSELHELAFNLIRLGVKLPDTSKTLNMYVNDAIGFRMTPEVCLYFSENCYGHADCAGFNNNVLRIHDLKTGITEAHVAQLNIYAALFCLEYGFTPTEIEIELRIYQNDEIRAWAPEIDELHHIIDKIRISSKRLDYLREEAL